MKITSIFTKVVETIKALITPPAEESTAEDEDTILTKISAPNDSLLYFLWACHKFLTEVASPPMQAIEDEASLDWEKKSRVNALGGANLAPIYLTGTN